MKRICRGVRKTWPWNGYPCGNPGKFFWEGKYYCKSHLVDAMEEVGALDDPVEIEKKVNEFLEDRILKDRLAVDAIVLAPVETRVFTNGIVLVKRKNEPRGWALPGGFVDYNESVEDAIHREVKEETGLDFIITRQFHTYSSPDRDPRRHVVTVVFVGTTDGIPIGADDAEEAKVFMRSDLPENIVFDHRDILEDYYNNRY